MGHRERVQEAAPLFPGITWPPSPLLPANGPVRCQRRERQLGTVHRPVASHQTLSFRLHAYVHGHVGNVVYRVFLHNLLFFSYPQK